jgi:hypothetical protein
MLLRAIQVYARNAILPTAPSSIELRANTGQPKKVSVLKD